MLNSSFSCLRSGVRLSPDSLAPGHQQCDLPSRYLEARPVRKLLRRAPRAWTAYPNGSPSTAAAFGAKHAIGRPEVTLGHWSDHPLQHRSSLTRLSIAAGATLAAGSGNSPIGLRRLQRQACQIPRRSPRGHDRKRQLPVKSRPCLDGHLSQARNEHIDRCGLRRQEKR